MTGPFPIHHPHPIRDGQTCWTSEPHTTIFTSSGATNRRELRGAGFRRSGFLIFDPFVKMGFPNTCFSSASWTSGSKELCAAREPHFDHVCYRFWSWKSPWRQQEIEGSGRGLIRYIIPAFVWRGWRRPRIITVRTPDSGIGIWTQKRAQRRVFRLTSKQKLSQLQWHHFKPSSKQLPRHCTRNGTASCR